MDFFFMAQTRTELGYCVYSEKHAMSKVKMLFDAHIFLPSFKKIFPLLCAHENTTGQRYFET